MPDVQKLSTVLEDLALYENNCSLPDVFHLPFNIHSVSFCLRGPACVHNLKGFSYLVPSF